MMRWLATVGIVVLAALVVFAQQTPLGRRGSEKAARAEVPEARLAVGDVLPALNLQHLDGTPFDATALRGHRTLITFERSVDW